MKTVAVMQPYFVPYAGYFRLFEVADVFVVYDCVQFPRRGYVHRNRLPDREGRPAWLTLPLRKAPRSAPIQTIQVAADAAARLADQRARFPSLMGAHPEPLLERLLSPRGSLASFLTGSLEAIIDRIGIRCEVIRSSSLGIAAHQRGQDRVLDIVEAVGGKRYVNAPGGRALYDHETFASRGIELNFLTPFVSRGSWSVLHHLVQSTPAKLAASIRNQVHLES